MVPATQLAYTMYKGLEALTCATHTEYQNPYWLALIHDCQGCRNAIDQPGIGRHVRILARASRHGFRSGNF